jgi:hypothetical protein
MRAHFQLENRGGGAHEAVLHVRRLPLGGYRVSVNGAMLPGGSLDVKVPVAAAGMTRVTVRQKHRSLTLAVQ